jgi:thioredoxin-like negative regulator of GroEL
MSGILYLGDDDFKIKQGDKGYVLGLTYESKGLTLVLFYSTECPYCINLINKFKQLPSRVNGCSFGMVNVNRNMSVVERSKNTIASISYVPDVILYVNGVPYVRYDGAHTIENIQEFIFDIHKKINPTSFIRPNEFAAQLPSEKMESRYPGPDPRMNLQQQSQTNEQQQAAVQASKFNKIPEYTIGTPLYGERKKERVCYLNFNSAYNNAQQQACTN